MGYHYLYVFALPNCDGNVFDSSSISEIFFKHKEFDLESSVFWEMLLINTYKNKFTVNVRHILPKLELICDKKGAKLRIKCLRKLLRKFFIFGHLFISSSVTQTSKF